MTAYKGQVLELSDVFKTKGLPSVTYVRRNEGKFEEEFRAAFEDSGTLVIVTGPSKSGKSTLYEHTLLKALYDIIPIRSRFDLSRDEVWKIALETINFERITSVAVEKRRKIGGEGGMESTFGWSWLAGIIGKMKLGISNETSESQIREKILAAPAASHLIPVLKNLPVAMLVEDFHYLSREVQRLVFQDWKVFVDNQVSAVLVGTSHRAVDLARANPDLIGRVAHIQIDNWSPKDLCKIAHQGFNYLKIDIPDGIIKMIAKESVGLPILTQSICRQLMTNIGIERPLARSRTKALEPEHVYWAFNQVAVRYYHGSFGPTLERIANLQIRESVYGKILSVFTLEPIIFSLNINQLCARLDELSVGVAQLCSKSNGRGHPGLG